MLGFQITYLRGVVTAADVSAGQKKDKVEWPPHPDRLFSALVQAWGDLGEPPNAFRALEALENAGAPWIQAGELLSVNKTIRYVPVNDRFEPHQKGKTKDQREGKTNDQKKLYQLIQGTGLGRDRKARVIPQGSLADPQVIVYWPEFQPSAEIRDALARLAAQVSHLGHSSSLVQVTLVEGLPDEGPTWKPDPSGSEALRVPFPGRLQELVEAYKRRKEAISWPPMGRYTNYSKRDKDADEACGHHDEMIPFRLYRDGLQLPLETAPRLLCVWRKALLAVAPQPVPEILSGHAPESTPDNPVPSTRPHLALAPLPDVGHPFATGRLLGVAAVLPRGVKAADREVVLRTLSQVSCLRLGSLGTVQLKPVDAFETRKALQPWTWSRSARIWASVTPVVLGKFPQRLFSEETCRIVEEACEIAGLPRPVRIDIAGVPWVGGSSPSARFPALPSRPGKPRRVHVHVRLEFASPVRGPVLVGAGRHLGYGIFRQLEEPR